MKRATQIVLLLTILGLCIGLTGCSSKDTDSATVGNSSETLAGSNVSANNPGRIAPNGPRGPGKSP